MSDQSITPEPVQTLRDYVRVLFRHLPVILISIIVVTCVAFVSVSFRTPVYEASVKMLVTGAKQVDAPYYKDIGLGGQTQASLTQTEIATSDPVLQRVVRALRLYEKPDDYEQRWASPLKNYWLNLQTQIRKTRMSDMSDLERKAIKFRAAVEDLRAHIKVTPVKETNIFVISVTDYDRYAAAILANVISRSYIIFDLEQQMAELQMKYGDKHPVVMQLNDNIERMKQYMNGRTLPDTDAIGPATVKVIEQAGIPLRPSGQRKGMLLLIAMVFSGFLGIILAFIFEYMDQTIKSAQDIERYLRIPVLGSLPTLRPRRDMFVKGALNKRTSRRQIKVFRDLADQVVLLTSTKGFKTLFIASSEKMDGEGFIVANLAYQLAAHGQKKVLVLELNFRAPCMAKLFGLTVDQTLIDAINGDVKLTDITHAINPRLFVLPAAKGGINPITFLDSAKMRQVVEELKKHFDLILISSAELKAFQDGYLSAVLADKTMMVVSENHTRRQVAAQELSVFKERNVQVLGAVLNNRTYPIPGFVYRRI